MSAARLLTLNAGSSSLKFGIYSATGDLSLQLSGEVSSIGHATNVRFLEDGAAVLQEAWPQTVDIETALIRLLGRLDWDGWSDGVVAVGHRIVHGGLAFTAPAWLTAETVTQLEQLSPLAPLHQPFNLRAVDIATTAFPNARQGAVFDTAFHAQQPEEARTYALPAHLRQTGVMGYGFHGLSYAYIADVMAKRYPVSARGRSIVLHLGSGASLCALDAGRSVATTMGFSALDGPPMSTRCGALDPGVVLYLMQERGMTAEAVSDLLYHQSGLLGLSGVSGDMAVLLASDEPAARQAIDVFCYRIAREIGSLAAALGGVDSLVFTAGIGEHAASIRKMIVERCAWLGAKLDDAANAVGASEIHARDSTLSLYVIPTDEQVIIARGLMALLGSG